MPDQVNKYTDYHSWFTGYLQINEFICYKASNFFSSWNTYMYKILGKIIGKYLNQLGVKKRFLKPNIIDRVQRGNIYRIDYVKIRNFLYQKHCSKIKRQITLKYIFLTGKVLCPYYLQNSWISSKNNNNNNKRMDISIEKQIKDRNIWFLKNTNSQEIYEKILNTTTTLSKLLKQ